MKTIIKDALILFAISAIAGILLAVVNEVTKKPIEEGKKAAVEAACREVFPEADHFTQGSDPGSIPEYQDFLLKYPKNSVDETYTAHAADGSPLGFVFNLTTKEGYGGDIRFSMGIDFEGTIKGVAILETSETPGLGMQAGEVLTPQFKDRKAESFVYVKGGGASAENEVDAISSATITTKAFVNGINAGLDYYRMVYGDITADSFRDTWQSEE